MRNRIITAAAVVALLAGLAVPLLRMSDGEDVSAAAQKGDAEVEIIFSNGQTRVYRDQVRSVDLIVAPHGQLTSVHLMLAKGVDDANTHEWYNYGQLAGFSYRYFELTGRGKVRVLREAPIQALEEVPDKLRAIRPDDYR